MPEENAKIRSKEIYRVTWLGSLVNMLLFVFKFISGILGHSGAMIADAVHSLSDFITDIIVLFFVKISSKPADLTHEYGHGKYETLATLIIAILLLFAGLGIAANSILELIDWLNGKELEKPGIIALVAAIVSIILKECLYQYTAKIGRKYSAKVVIANAWHHRSDALSSVGTMIGVGGAIVLGAKWRILDPIAAVVVSGFIIHVAIKLIRPAAEELLEKSLPSSTQMMIEDIVLSNPGIYSMHNLCTRRIGNILAIEFHVRMDGKQTLIDAHYRTMEIERELKQKFGENTHIVIHMEPNKSEYTGNDKQ